MNPQEAEAVHSRGIQLFQQGEFLQAAEAIGRAVEAFPKHPIYLNSLGAAFARAGRFQQAAEAFGKAVALRPDLPEAHNNLANCLRANRQYDAAIGAYRRATDLRPNYPEALYNLGNTLQTVGQLDEAIRSYRQAIHYRPHFAAAYDNLGGVLALQGNLDEAVMCHRQALVLNPRSAEAHYNLALALQKQHRHEEAIDVLHRAVGLRADYADAHWALAMSQLWLGDFKNGWREYEWRLRGRVTDATLLYPTKPRWTGEDIAGRTILLHAEQGFGDNIQFIRYAKLLAERGGRVCLSCSTPLARLMKSAIGVDQVIELGQSMIDFDLQSPLLSLPLVFGTTLETIPSEVPYILPEPACVRRWSERLKPFPGFKVGLVWSGNPHQTDNARRSVPLELMLRWAGLPNLHFFSLQTGEAGGQLKLCPDGHGIIDWTHELVDWVETAGLIAGLDLILSVDTALAHLAGAIGKLAWVLLSSDPDFRWLPTGSKCTWYPTMQLFRQIHDFKWNEPLELISRELVAISSRP